MVNRGLAALALITLGCGPGNLASKASKAPTYAAGQCSATKSQAEPLTVEWPSTVRAKLESTARKGIVAVKYSGCSMDILPHCQVTGAYAWSPIVRKHDRVAIKDADALYAALPFGAASLEAKLATKGELNVEMTIVGRYEASRTTVRADELTGDCAGATHVVSAMSAGAFRFFAGSSAEASAGGAAFGAKAGGASGHSEETLNEDGSEVECAKALATDKGAPPGCGAILRLEVVAIGEGKPCPPRTSWDGKYCSAKQDCPRGSFREYGVCIPSGVKYDLSAACEQPDVSACLAECDAGKMDSCAEVAWRLNGGVGAARDEGRGAALARKACDGGSLRGCANFASALQHGSGGVTRDPVKAGALYDKACPTIAVACVNLALLLSDGVAVAKDLPRAATTMDSACTAGNASACWRAGDNYLNGWGVPANDKTAFERFNRSCTLGSAIGCGAIGWAYTVGRGVSQSHSEAADFYRRACDGGEPRGCGELGGLYSMGSGVMRDYAKAASLATMACNGGHQNGCANYAWALVNGFGVPKDVPRGISLYRAACEARNGPACRDLAVFSREGTAGLDKDQSAATMMATRACELGDALGCDALGWQVEHGLGTPLNVPIAISYYKKACTMGQASACANLKRLGASP